MLESALNQHPAKHHPPAGELSPAHLLNEILMARADTALSAHYGGEFYTSALSSRIIRLRHHELLKRAGINANELKEFQEIALPDTPTIREVIDSGEKSFDEFLSILDKSQRFRDWIQTVNPDEKLVHAYMRDVTAEGWITKLPSKTLRYVLGSIVGAVSPVIGLGLSAVDSLLIEKLLGGWRQGSRSYALIINRRHHPLQAPRNRAVRPETHRMLLPAVAWS